MYVVNSDFHIVSSLNLTILKPANMVVPGNTQTHVETNESERQGILYSLRSWKQK